MAHFAKIVNNIVEQVIVGDDDLFTTDKHIWVVGGGKEWIQTSFNTFAGQHLQGGIPLRKNFASKGFTYDYQRDAFIPPKEYDSWILNEETCRWDPPKEKPEGNYFWDEQVKDWVYFGDSGTK